MDELSFVEICQPATAQELMMIKMLFDRDGIHYYVNNEYAGRWMMPVIAPVGASSMRVMVQSDQAEEARNLLREELGMQL